MTDTRVHLANKHGDANDNQVYVFATSLESLKRKVDVCWEKTEVGICLTVQDTGIGCAPDVVNQIFEPFVVGRALGCVRVTAVENGAAEIIRSAVPRQDSSESRKREGIGLGLAVTRRVRSAKNGSNHLQPAKFGDLTG